MDMTPAEDGPTSPPAESGDSPLPHNWSPRRTRHHRAPATPRRSTVAPMEISTVHAKDPPRSAPPTPASLHRLPDPGPFSLTGGYKTAQASNIAQQLVVTRLNVGGLTARKLDFTLPDRQGWLTPRKTNRIHTRPLLQGTLHYTPLSKDTRTRRPASRPLVGGFFCIVNERWGASLLPCKSDRTNLGVLAYLLTCLPHRTTDGPISTIGSYWPIPCTDNTDTDPPGSCWAQIRSWCRKHDVDKSPSTTFKTSPSPG